MGNVWIDDAEPIVNEVASTNGTTNFENINMTIGVGVWMSVIGDSITSFDILASVQHGYQLKIWRYLDDPSLYSYRQGYHMSYAEPADPYEWFYLLIEPCGDCSAAKRQLNEIRDEDNVFCEFDVGNNINGSSIGSIKLVDNGRVPWSCESLLWDQIVSIPGLLFRYPTSGVLQQCKVPEALIIAQQGVNEFWLKYYDYDEFTFLEYKYHVSNPSNYYMAYHVKRGGNDYEFTVRHYLRMNNMDILQSEQQWVKINRVWSVFEGDLSEKIRVKLHTDQGDIAMDLRKEDIEWKKSLSDPSPALHKSVEYQTIPATSGSFEIKVSDTLYHDSNNTWRTAYNYYLDDDLASYRNIHAIERPDGHNTIYKYYDQPNDGPRGLLAKVSEPYLDLQPTVAAPNVGKIIEYKNYLQDPDHFYYTPGLEDHYIKYPDGTTKYQYSASYNHYDKNGSILNGSQQIATGFTLIEKWEEFALEQLLGTKTLKIGQRLVESNGSNSLLFGNIIYTINPDNSMTGWTYTRKPISCTSMSGLNYINETAGIDGWVEESIHGTSLETDDSIELASLDGPDEAKIYLIDGKSLKNVKYRNHRGYLVQSRNYVYLSGDFVLIDWTNYEYDTYGRVKNSTSGTNDDRVINSKNYLYYSHSDEFAGRLSSVTDENGIEIKYTIYDALGNVLESKRTEKTFVMNDISVTSKEFTNQYEYDASGKLTKELIIGDTEEIQTGKEYYASGVIQSETDKNGFTTNYMYSDNG